MASLRKVIWLVGESENGLSSREIAQMIKPDDIKAEALRVHSFLYRYKYFFLSEPISKNPNTGKRYTLAKNGIRFYEKLSLTYDPITDTQIIPQEWINPFKQAKIG